MLKYMCYNSLGIQIYCNQHKTEHYNKIAETYFIYMKLGLVFALQENWHLVPEMRINGTSSKNRTGINFQKNNICVW